MFLSFSEPKQVSRVLIYYLQPQFPLHISPNWNNGIPSLLRLSRRVMAGVLEEKVKSDLNFLFLAAGGADEERLFLLKGGYL